MAEETNLIQSEANPCDGCTKCCNHIAIELDKPDDEESWDNLRWYLVHKNVWIFVDHDDSWNIQFNSPCEKVNQEGWCGIYETRPKICRNYTTRSCEKYGDGESFKQLFKTLEEFDDWNNKGRVI
jgi:uncharacterized protein